MKTKKKLLVPVAMLVLAVMAVTSATFAWFTSNSTVRATISNANVVSDGTMLFVVDQSKYSAAENVLWQSAYDTEYDAQVTAFGTGSSPTASDIAGFVAAATAVANAAVANSTTVNSLLDDTANWAYSTQFSYDMSDLEMLDLTYTRDNDQTRYAIKSQLNPYAGQLLFYAPTDYTTAYDASYGNDVDPEVGYTGAYATAYADEKAIVRAAALAEAVADYQAANPGATVAEAEADPFVQNQADQAVDPTYPASAANITAIKAAAAAAADLVATQDAIDAVEGTLAANDALYTSTYNSSYTTAYDAAYAAELIAATGEATLAAAEAVATIRQVNAAKAAAAATAVIAATDAADLALAGKATTAKVDIAKADVAYIHYGINDSFNMGDHTLYNKSIFNTTDTGTVTSAKAVANKDYIDLTYTFWCGAPSVGVTNKLALDIGAAANLTSYINSQAKSIAFNTLDRDYFLAQGPADERVAQFYGGTGAVASSSVANEIQSADGLYYVFNDAGTYDSRAAYASRVMFTNIDQSGGGTDEILGIWEPNATMGYDAVDGTGARIETLDIQDMYNKAQANVMFDDLTPITYVNRYNETTSPKLLTPSANNDIELIPFINDYTDATGAYYRAQINVKIWLEGFDSDCFNVILGDILDIGLQFKAYAGI